MNKVTNLDNDHESTSAQSTFVRTQFLDIHLKQVVRSCSGLFVCALVIFALLLTKVETVWPYLWLVSVLIVLTSRVITYRSWLNSTEDHMQAISVWHFIQGVLFGLPIIAFGKFSDIDRTIISIILIAISTASVSTTNGYQHKYLWFITPMLIPLSAAWVITSSNINSPLWAIYSLSFLLVLYFLYLTGLGRDLFRLFNESCQIRFMEQKNNAILQIALEEAKNASLAKTRFLASASHDLRQPMHTIGVLLAALGMRQLDDRSREIVDVLGTVNASLASQLDGLLDISKLDAGVVAPDFKVYRLDDMLRAHVSKIALAEKKEDLYLRVHASQEVLVRTDAVLLDRILMNLIGNAIKFTEIGGIDITLSATNDKAILEVTDTGIGIAENYQTLVFQEFYQIGNPERDRNAGLGLGLSIVKRLCVLLDVHLHLISEPGQGCRFVLTMPLVFDAGHQLAKKELTEACQLPPMTVLVVDDEIDIRTGMRLLLEELGCTVVLADGITQAVNAARVQKFHVVFSDYRLRADENGIDAIGHVRVIQPGINAVLITGDTAPERLQSAKNAGIKMLHKPVSFDDIVKQLQIASADA